MTDPDDQTSAASPNTVTDRRRTRRPQIPAGAQTEHRTIDEQGTLYAPTALAVQGLFYLNDACPMRYDVAVEDTYLEFGAAHLELSLLCSDQALINLARLANKAVRMMVHRRGMPLPDPIIGREPD